VTAVARKKTNEDDKIHKSVPQPSLARKGAFPLQKAILRALIVEDYEPMRKYDGIEATLRIQKVHPKSKILFVTENCSPDVAKEALRSGGLRCVLNSNAEEDLLPAVDAILRSKRFISFGLAGTLPRSRRSHRIGRVLRPEGNAKI